MKGGMNSGRSHKSGTKKMHTRGTGTIAGSGNLGSERNHGNVGPDGYRKLGTGYSCEHGTRKHPK